MRILVECAFDIRRRSTRRGHVFPTSGDVQLHIVRVNRGHFLHAEGKIDKALKAYVKAIKLCKTYDRPLYDGVDLKIVKSRQFNDDQREKLWSALWKAYPEQPNAPNNAGLWYSRE